MLKSILHPGNGYIFPLKGDYVKVQMDTFNSNKQLMFSSVIMIRIDYDLAIKPEIMNLIKEMSLLEKCSIEIIDSESSDCNNINNKGNINSLSTIYEIELLDISSIPLVLNNNDELQSI
jgi:hypothetical protein